MSRREEPGSVREEAERLVATTMAMAALAARGLSSGDKPTGGDQATCACPLCRLVSAIRDPEPEFAGRVATTVGDVAAGVAGVLRSVAEHGAGGRTREQPNESGYARSTGTNGPDWSLAGNVLSTVAHVASDAFAARRRSDGARNDDDPWKFATREAETWPMAPRQPARRRDIVDAVVDGTVESVVEPAASDVDENPEQPGHGGPGR